MEINESISKFQEYLQHNKELERKIMTKQEHITIDYKDFISFDLDLVNELNENPEETLKAFELAIAKLRDEDQPRLKVRFKNVDEFESSKIRIRDIRVKHYSKFYVVTGVIRHISQIYPEVFSRKFECPNCGNILHVLQKRFEDKKEPRMCGCGRKGKFTELEELMIDTQKMVIEEEFDTLEGNQQPNKIDILIQHSLTSKNLEKFNTLGARVSITGILLSRPKIIKGRVSNELDKYIEANYIKALDEKYLEIEINQKDVKMIKEYSKRKDFLDICANSFAPHIAGYNEVKKAIILQLYGGVNSIDSKSKKKNRGDFHILLCGDPSMGKTQLGMAVEPIALKYRYTSGARSSKAGLTVTLIKDEFINAWGLEAGALILANKGICVMDEFDKMTEADREALHEQMESQQITIDKANIHTTLQAQTSILACANWKDSRFNPNMDVYSQIDMPDSIISRFDLYFAFIDRAGDNELDTKVIKHVLRARANHLYEEDKKEEEIVPYDFWKKHIIYAKQFNPKITKEIADKIVDYYVKLRGRVKNQTQITIPITARQGEAIQRLSEASARMHLRDVTEEDVQTAINLIEHSLHNVAFDSGKFDIDIIETGISTKKRNLLFDVRAKLKELGSGYNNGQIPIDALLNSFDKSLHDEIDDIIEKMLKNGDCFEPRRGFIKEL